MKIFRATAAIAFFVALMAVSAFAQPRTGAGTGTTPARPTATPAPAPPTSVNVPDSKVAIIDSSAFADEKQGIAKFVSALKKVNAEFQPRQTELQGLQQQIEKATADLQKAAPVQDPKVTQQQQDKIDQMKKDFQRKGEDAQAAFNKRLEEVLSPIYEDIGRALDTFAKARGITLILDVTKVQGIVSAADSIDITRAFIAEYNSKNPATASLTTPQ
ncbi:MAG TPA: OmpH family outer membrane protein [Pyrinomonadaceae bacterium]|jgi:outer membrane protein|nr:OmpH family outer membrane protein [Pyrinomonadaceae bacterium]